MANLLKMEANVPFFETTTGYREIEGVGEEDMRRWGYRNDGRPDLAWVVVGFAFAGAGSWCTAGLAGGQLGPKRGGGRQAGPEGVEGGRA